MLSSLRAFPRILLEHWPALLAWYLAGNVVRLGIMYAAAPLSTQQPVLALLFLPLAVLARLISYVAMFLTVRRSMPGYQAAIGEAPARTRREAVARFATLLFPAVAPFFFVYGLVGGVEGDLSTYARIAYTYSNPFAGNGTGTTIGGGPVVIGIIVVAFLARQILSRLGDRLPSGIVVVQIYLDATWTFVAVSGIANILGGVIAWIQNRQVIALYLDARRTLSDAWSGFELAFQGIDGFVPTFAQFVLNPLAWIFVTALIYIQSIADVRRTRIIPRGMEIRARARLALMPGWLARGVRGFGGDWDGTYKPAILGIRMVLRMGLPSFCVALAAWGALFALQQWGLRLIVLGLGPHEDGFWEQAVGVINIVVSAIAEPIRIALLASVFDGMLTAWRQRSAVRRPQPVLSE